MAPKESNIRQRADEELRQGQQAFNLGDLEKVAVRTADISSFTAEVPAQKTARYIESIDQEIDGLGH